MKWKGEAGKEGKPIEGVLLGGGSEPLWATGVWPL